VFVVPPVLAFAFRTRLPVSERRFLLAGSAVLGASIVASVAWGMAQAGGMYHFNGYFYYAIYFFALLLGLGLLAPTIERFARWPVVALAGIAAAGIFFWTGRASTFSEEEKGLPIQRGIAAALRADPDPRPKLLVFEHAHWPEAAGVALALRRHGVGFYAAPWWTFMFQRRHDATTLGPEPEKQTSLWWITPSAAGGHPITRTLSIHHQPAPLLPAGGEIRFHAGENGVRYVALGISTSIDEFTWTNLPRVALRFAPGPTKEDVRIVFDAESADTSRPTSAEVMFNGAAVGSVSVQARAEVSVTIPATLWNQRPAATLELRFPQATLYRAKVMPAYENWRGWALWKIRCETVRTAEAPAALRHE
jgi:hypothetical protein